MGLFDKFTKTENNTSTVNAAPANPERTIDLKKKASISLQKHNIAGVKAAVYLVLDYSGSMRTFYRNHTVQDFAEKVLAVGSQLDDDGVVPIILFDSTARRPVEAHLDSSAGLIDNIVAKAGHMGTTSYADAMEAVIQHYKASGSSEPALVIFQTDGSPDSRAKAEKMICESATLPIFWQFVGFGNDSFDFLRKLDDLAVPKKRVIDNAGFFAAGNDPKNIPTDELYDNILNEFPTWLQTAKAEGIIRN